MRFIRLTALLISLVLLVASVVSVLHRRGDLRDDQVARVEQSASLASTSIRSSILRVRQDVHFAALAAARGEGSDDAAIATDLALFFPSSDVCVGTSAEGCTGADLFAMDEVNQLAAASDALNGSDSNEAGSNDTVSNGAAGARATIAVDAESDSLLVVRRIMAADDSAGGWVALRLPIDELVSTEAFTTIRSVDADLDVVPGRGSSDDLRSGVDSSSGRRMVNENIGSLFLDGSLEVTSSVDATIGIAGDQFARYGLLFALGAVLLALAGWTFMIERRHLERRATTDELTGLINRREFERLSEVELDGADRSNGGLCIMVIDLNGFKQVNDTLGHQFGDLVLAASSERLVGAVRDTDVVARWGGDEFVILLPGLTERTAVRRSAERIWENLAGTPVVGDTTMSASIGAAIFPRHGIALDALMRAADVAMYEAKTTGVSHRIADTIAVGDSLLADGDGVGTPPVAEVFTDEYAGPDRRHSPVPPPPPAPGQVAEHAPQPPRDQFDPSGSPLVDEPSSR